TPAGPLRQAAEYKERSSPVGNLLKELVAQGKLTPIQTVLPAPTMPQEELYDLEADPHEVNNLATSPDPAHRAVLERLRSVLDRWIEETDDQGRIPESPEVAAAKGATRPGSDPNAGSGPRVGETRARPN